MLYDISQKRKWDNQAFMEGALEDGMKKGLEQGIEKGLEQGKQQGSAETQLEIAKALKTEGLSLDLIAKTTGLSLQEIETL